MANTYSLGGAAPTHATVSNYLLQEAQFLVSVHAQADAFFRTYAQLLQTDQQKTNAGVDFATYPDDKYRLDVMGTLMTQLRGFLEGSAAAAVVDTRDLCAQIINVG
jgi:hypothetical protein